ncbi:helix-turn-helix domain-containing protein [Hansschlegelia sp. KR7-227]|uniref:helix-turn-helix domain-containing protein n=1 Tax=Hansschlegelia sp. KR7-227 TaxID=3400914 RepID=UPI003C056265
MTGFDHLLVALNVSAGPFSVLAFSAGLSTSLDAESEPFALYVLSGSGRLSAPGQAALALDQDAFVLAPGGLRCRLDPSPGFKVAYGSVAGSFGGAAGPFDGLRGPMATSFAGRPMREAFLALMSELASPGFGSRALANCIVKQALVTLMRDAFTSGGQAALPWIAALRDDRLGRAVAAMIERPSDPLTLDVLARIAGMSRSTFSERFSAALGRPPIDFLREIRLDRAARMLASTDLPVKRIANAVGYESRSYFSRAFRSRFDIDPSDYRASRAGCC